MEKKPKFKGYDWAELVNYWGLEQETVKPIDNADWEVPETKEINVFVGDTKVTVETSEVDEVEKEKLIEFIGNSFNEDHTMDKEVREVLNAFLDALIEQSENIDYNAPVFKGIRAIEDDITFCRWFVNNVGAMWT